MNASKETTLRLVFPQWQGGNNPPYYFGSQLLSWLAPDPTGPVEHVEVEPSTDEPPEIEDGIVGRSALLQQLRRLGNSSTSIARIVWWY